jgi:hypothetical protein
MQNIILDVGNNAQNILPVPYTKPPVPSVANPNNYGDSPYPMPIKMSSRIKDDLQYCNFLEPSPRDQRLNVPYEGKKNCPKFTAQPYNKDSCFLMNSNAQGVVGIVCNQAGGSDNADFERGNEFGVDYPFDQNLNKKMLEYTVENPVQLPLELQNPMMLYDKQEFYPENNFFLRKNKDYLTYPLQQNYTKNGIPTYTYPYKTLNPIVDDPTQVEDIVYEDFKNNKNSKSTGFFIIAILLLIFIFFIYRKK